MLVLQGYYSGGRVEIYDKVPEISGKVLILFTENNIDDKEMTESDWKLFNEFSGSITRVIDVKKELSEGLSEKYACTC